MMKLGLQRIEAMLDHLNSHRDDPAPTLNQPPNPPLNQTGNSSMPRPSSDLSAASLSTVQPFPLPTASTEASMEASLADFAQPSPLLSPLDADLDSTAFRTAQPSPHDTPEMLKSELLKPEVLKSEVLKSEVLKSEVLKSEVLKSEMLKPFSAKQGKVPSLPKTKPAAISRHRHAVNPNLAVNLLKEIEAKVVSWQLELEQIILQIQAVYLEGPIVDGWLESQSADSQPPSAEATKPSVSVATLRHAEIDHLMNYVEEICNTSQTPSPSFTVSSATPTSEESPRADYRLCGLDADGQLWQRPCPMQQVPYVSLAIARYQKLRTLLGKKQALETRLNQLIQSLTVLSSQIQK
ncbi:MAG: hypothetical protein MUF49_28580 [Oculatellaceae cyanobacterium Prado106]|nr:hypothetical protein [Oculatellaceae cyanobacterium Prado106]